MSNEIFTQDELRQIEAIPKEEMGALIGDMVGMAKRTLFIFIERQTGIIPPNDYMMTHSDEFDVEWASGEDHSIASKWSWRGQHVVKQRGIIVFKDGHLQANVKTEAIHD